VALWSERGRRYRAAGHEIFAIDTGDPGAGRDPLLVLHGFPTCSFDFHLVLPALARERRVVLVDMLGYGQSDKPDARYPVELQADIVQAVVATMGLERMAMLTHDMGDTVGGELLARQLDGAWPVEITRRVLTNGSIYIAMAHLSTGQQLLLGLPDEHLADAVDPDGSGMRRSLRATFSPHAVVDDGELDAAWELIAHRGGDRMLPRTIRYIEDRRRNEDRYTGAIETHPSPLGVVWGEDDPIAVVDMAHRLAATRSDLSLCILPGVGHYPMVESPQRFADEVLSRLD
jgi:pimeloyl-ACP methyl ester carboxylesterase